VVAEDGVVDEDSGAVELLVATFFGAPPPEPHPDTASAATIATSRKVITRFDIIGPPSACPGSGTLSPSRKLIVYPPKASGAGRPRAGAIAP
jgi:hypothetical protein